MTANIPARAEMEVAPAPQYAERYNGVGGWLLLLGFALATTPIKLGLELWPSLAALADNGAWRKFITPDDPVYAPRLLSYLCLELLANFAIAVGSLVCLALLMAKSHAFPRLAWIFYISSIAISLVDSFVGATLFDLGMTSAELGALFRSSVVAMIWLRYLAVSKRVAHTFGSKPSVQ